jgi:hypothetical protein
MIVRVADRFWLWNLEPASEPHVNGRPTARAELTEGTVVALGGSEFRFHVAAAPAPAAPAPTPAPAPVKTAAQAPKPAAALAPSAAAKRRSAEVPPLAKPSTKQVGPSAPKPGAPTAKSSSQSPPTAHLPAETTNRARTNGGKTLHEDDAKAIKGWGPLALAVAAADRPELQGGPPAQAPRVPQPPAPVESTGARPRRRWIGIVLSLVVVVAGAAAGAVFAWQHWKH